MPLTATERSRNYREKHRNEETYKQTNRENVKKWQEANAEKYRLKHNEYNKAYRDRLKQQETVDVVPPTPQPVKSYYQRKKESIEKGEPMLLLKRGRKPKITE